MGIRRVTAECLRLHLIITVVYTVAGLFANLKLEYSNFLLFTMLIHS